MRLLVASTVLVLATACSTVPLAPMKQAALADNVSTVLAESQGFDEINPLGFPATVVLKLAVIEYSRQLPPEDRQFVERVSVAVWGGAAVNNVSLIFGLSSALAPVVGIAAAALLWQSQDD